MEDQLERLLDLQRQRSWQQLITLSDQLLTVGFHPADRHFVGIVGAVAADAYMHLQLLPKAQELIERARGEVLDSTLAHAYTLAVGVAVLSLRGWPQKAIAWGREFLDKLSGFPERGQGYFGAVCHDMASAYRNLHQPDDAIASLRMGSAAVSASAPKTACYFRVFEAELELDRGNITVASALVAGIEPKDIPEDHLCDYYVVKGRVALASAATSDAARLAMQALAWAGSCGDGEVWAYLLMGDILMLTGQAEDARQHSQRAALQAVRAGRVDLYNVAKEQLERQGGALDCAAICLPSG